VNLFSSAQPQIQMSTNMDSKCTAMYMVQDKVLYVYDKCLC